MNESEWKNVPEEFENIRDKWDYLDWDRLPTGPCDMNYRPSSAAYSLLASLFLVLIVSWASFAIADLIRLNTGVPFGNLFLASLILLSVVVAITVATMRKPADSHSKWVNVGVFVATIVIGPIVLLTISTALASTRTQFGALIVLAIFVFPATLLLADALATHSVHWFSAHPSNDHATMTGWRRDWSRRWAVIPTRQPRRTDLSGADLELHQRVMWERETYLNGVLFLFAVSVILPIGIYFLIRRAPTYQVGACIAASILFALAVVGEVRCVKWHGSFRQYLKCLAHWFVFANCPKCPPWVFQSPVGSWLCRCCFTFFVLFLASAALIPLADWGNWFLLAESQRGHVPLSLIAHAAEYDSAGFNFLPVFATSYVGLFLFARWLTCLLLPVLYLILAGYLVAGPAIAAHHAALEAPTAYEQHSEWLRFDGYVERLQHSSNPLERSAMFIGLHTLYDYPILLDVGLLFEHLHLLGGTGTGKTALGLNTHMIQLIRRGDGPVVIIDCKGDPALFHTARLEAQKAGRNFKWLTNKPGRATYIFNPLDFRAYRHFTVADVVGFLAQALNMIHGQDYGRAWFTIAARILMKRSFEATIPNSREPHSKRRFSDLGPINSFQDLNRMILRLAVEEDVSAAQHLAFLIESLSEFEQLNLASNRNPNHPALAHAIYMPEVVREKQVVYFYLEGATDLVTVAEIGRLGLFSLLSACMAYKDEYGKAPRAYCIADEAQALIATNISNVLAQARSHGLAVLLSHQAMSQLAPAGGPDLRELVMSCTCVKQVFSARDPWLQDYLSTVSGRTKYVTLSQAWDSVKGWIPTYTYTTGPRLSPQDIFDVNRDENLCIATIERGKGLSRTNGYFPLHVDWPLTEQEYQTRTERTPWPPDSSATVTVNPPWPEPTSETIVPEDHPPLSPLDISAAAEAKLRKLREQLDD